MARRIFLTMAILAAVAWPMLLGLAAYLADRAAYVGRHWHGFLP